MSIKLLSALPESTLEDLVKQVFGKVEKDLKLVIGLLNSKHMSDGLEQNIAGILHDAINDHSAPVVFAWLKNNTTETVFISKHDSKTARDWCNKVLDSSANALEPYLGYYGDKFDKTLLYKIKTEREEKEMFERLLKVGDKNTIIKFINEAKNKEAVLEILIKHLRTDIAIEVIATFPTCIKDKKEVLRDYFGQVGDEGVVDLKFVEMVVKKC